MNNQNKALEKLIESNLKLTSTVSETLDFLRLKFETESEIEKLEIKEKQEFKLKLLDLLSKTGALDILLNSSSKFFDSLRVNLKGDKNEPDSTTK